MHSSPILISIADATISFKGKQLFTGLDFTWTEGQHWAIVGDSGTLLTGFLESILGSAVVLSGAIHRPFAQHYIDQMLANRKPHSFRDLISYVSQDYRLKNKSNLQNFYFQQRFNSSEVDEALSVREYMLDSGTKPGVWTVENVAELLDLQDLLSESILKLSNGETRRLALALGLLRQPKIFLMDQPTTGLDQASRQNFGGFLKKVTESGVHVLLTCSVQEIPQGITQVGKIGASGLEVKRYLADEKPTTTLSYPFDLAELRDLAHSAQERGEELIRLSEVSISYQKREILRSLNWTLKSGEKWQIKGPNGSGKSTLISLLIGENPQAYAQDIWLFGRKRGSGESIWDIKRPIGFVAPELARFFPANQTCKKVILSGLFDSMGLFKKVSQDQESLAERWLRLFQLEEVAQIPIRRLSLEHQRWTLLARALIKRPKLLILDEASQGLDDRQRLIFRETVQALCESPTISLIYVSHYDEDVPPAVDQVLTLPATPD
ncbi:ATP-binding cassette domain-containing protein [Algoriphagus namhaensis]